MNPLFLFFFVTLNVRNLNVLIQVFSLVECFIIFNHDVNCQFLILHQYRFVTITKLGVDKEASPQTSY